MFQAISPAGSGGLLARPEAHAGGGLLRGAKRRQQQAVLLLSLFPYWVFFWMNWQFIPTHEPRVHPLSRFFSRRPIRRSDP
jgi:hypothetical protein